MARDDGTGATALRRDRLAHRFVRRPIDDPSRTVEAVQ